MATIKPNTQASLLGAGAGTGFIGVVQAIPEAFSQWEAFLTFGAPWLTIVCAAGWMYIGSWWKRRKFEISVEKAKLFRDRAIADPHLSEAAKERARRAYENLAQLLSDLDCEAGRAVGVSLAAHLTAQAGATSGQAAE